MKQMYRCELPNPVKDFEHLQCSSPASVKVKINDLEVNVCEEHRSMGKPPTALVVEGYPKILFGEDVPANG